MRPEARGSLRRACSQICVGWDCIGTKDPIRRARYELKLSRTFEVLTRYPRALFGNRKLDSPMDQERGGGIGFGTWRRKFDVGIVFAFVPQKPITVQYKFPGEWNLRWTLFTAKRVALFYMLFFRFG